VFLNCGENVTFLRWRASGRAGKLASAQAGFTRSAREKFPRFFLARLGTPG